MSRPGVPDTITAYDANGHPMQIRREDWRTQVLPGMVRDAWNDADALAGVVGQAIRDDLAADVIEAANRLVQLENDAERGGVLLGVCLLETGQTDGARAVFEATLTANPASASAMVNLAKLAHQRGDAAGERDLIERAVRADPNYSVSLNYLAGLRRDAEGEEGWLAAMQDAARLPGAWRPQLWLARAALTDDDLHGALQWYEQSLERAPDEPDALMQATGDLGKAGRTEQMLTLGLPRYRPAVHGLPAGMNLLEAALQLDRLAEAQRLLHELYALDRPDLRTTLRPYADRVDTLRAAASTSPAPDPGGHLDVRVVASSRPPWWRWLAAPDWLLPTPSTPTVVFLALTVGVEHGETARAERTEWRGRVSRGTAWFLADLVRFAGGASAVALPVVVGGGPVLSGSPDSPDSIRTYLQAAALQPRVVVTGTVGGSEEAPLLDLQVRAAPDWRVVVPLSGVPIEQAWPAVAQALQQGGELPPPRPVPAPAAPLTNRVVLGYDALSSFTLAASGATSVDNLWGERASVDFLLDTAGETSADLATLQLLASLVAMTAYGSDIPSEYRRRTTELLHGTSVADVTRRLAPLLGALFGERPAADDHDEAYRAWLSRLGDRPWWT